MGDDKKRTSKGKEIEIASLETDKQQIESSEEKEEYNFPSFNADVPRKNDKSKKSNSKSASSSGSIMSWFRKKN